MGVEQAMARSPEQVFAQIRALRDEARFEECVAFGREAAPGLVQLEVIWVFVAECEARVGAWCEAHESVQRFLVVSAGAAKTRIADAQRLAAEALERCESERSRAACIDSYASGDWERCEATCASVTTTDLPRSKIAMRVHCLLGLERCDEAAALVVAEDVPSLDPGDAERIASCTSTRRRHRPAGPAPPPTSAPTTSGPGPGPWLVGFGAAAVVTGVVFFTLAESDARTIARLTPSPSYDADYESLTDSYRTRSLVAHLTTWSGAALAGAGLVWWLSRDSPAASSSTALQLNMRGGVLGIDCTTTF